MSKLTRDVCFEYANSYFNLFKFILRTNRTLFPSEEIVKNIGYCIIKIYMIYEQQTFFDRILFSDKCPCDKHACILNFWPRVWWMNNKLNKVVYKPFHCEMKDCHIITYDKMSKCIYCDNRICSKHHKKIIEQDQIIILCNQC